MTVNIDLHKLLESGAHFGHQRKRLYPKMLPFMHEMKENVFVFDLIQTQKLLEEALAFVTKLSQEDKKILFVHTKKQAKEKTIEVAKNTGNYYIDVRWLGGTFSNFGQIKRTIGKLSEYENELKNAKEIGYTKKEKLILSRKIDDIKNSMGGILNMKDFPDAVFVIDVRREKGAVIESKKQNIPVIGIVDSNSNPDNIDYVIPMNDDAAAPLEYVMSLVEEAWNLGQNKTKAKKTK